MKRRLTLGALAAAIGIASCVRQAKHPATRPMPVATRPPTSGRPTNQPPPPDVRPDEGDAPRPAQVGGKPVRIALALRRDAASVGATGAWRLYDRDGASVMATGETGDAVSASRFGSQVRLERVAVGAVSFGAPAAATPIGSRDGPYVLRPSSPSDYVTFDGRRYRGELVLTPDAVSGFTVANRVGVDDYLRGVLPLEIGDRPATESAAAEAQAVAARSYAYTHLVPGRAWDLQATVADQVYGGVSVEKPSGDRAVATTAGLVLTYGGRVISAPYHSTCGGQTAAASEVWQGASDEPFLRSVSDRVGDSERFYCDGSPRFTWTRTLEPASLDAAVARYLRDYAAVPADGPGIVRSVRADGTTTTGRVTAVTVATARGSYSLRGNAMRYVLRSLGGEILNSTYFTVDPQSLRGGAPLTLRGRGYGHGIGMCQWGAIGRARAGQDFRTILSTYYPGTRVERVD
jgi:stage II sporulation protein D